MKIYILLLSLFVLTHCNSMTKDPNQTAGRDPAQSRDGNTLESLQRLHPYWYTYSNGPEQAFTMKRTLMTAISTGYGNYGYSRDRNSQLPLSTTTLKESCFVSEAGESGPYKFQYIVRKGLASWEITLFLNENKKPTRAEVVYRYLIAGETNKSVPEISDLRGPNDFSFNEKFSSLIIPKIPIRGTVEYSADGMGELSSITTEIEGKSTRMTNPGYQIPTEAMKVIVKPLVNVTAMTFLAACIKQNVI